MIPQQQRNFLINHIVDKLTEFIIKDNNVDITSALKTVYQSKVYQLILDIDGDLYSQSPSYIYDILKSEINDKEVS